MFKLHTLAPLAALLFAAACNSSEGAEDLLPLFDASNVIATDSALPASDAGVASGVSATAWDAGIVTDASLSDAISAPAQDPRSDASARGDSAVDVAMTSDAAIVGDAASPGNRSTTPDGSSPDAATGTGTCGGATPHGCWPPKAGNPEGCPAQIHEQSEFYPPLEEWVECSSPFYERCVYLRPDRTEADRACDLGVHWLCTY
jgi:hypothetical protein